MIEDEKALIQVDEFRRIFFPFFKGEVKASIIYEKLLPQIVVWLSLDDEETVYTEAHNAPQNSKKMVSIQKLSLFIDGFNFSPVKVSDIHYKNDSEEMTYIMTSNTKGNLADQD